MPKRILAVDDSPSMLRMVKFTLEEAGYEVLTAEDGEDALRMIEGVRLHMVITDLYMPKIDGLDLVKALRARKDTRFVPIFMLTTESQEQKKDLGRAAGATGWIVKPFSREQLVSIARQVAGAPG